MNERIKEFAEQAGLKYYNWVTNESNINEGTFKYPRLEDYEKFAELIVQECADIAEETQWMVPPSQEQIARSIRQHFGVEE